MAKDKRSFILYADQKSIFDSLSDREAGVLIKHIYSYVNDENPVINNKLLKIAFDPIKQQLKRDLVEWEQERKDRSAAGKKGMAKRWGKPTTKITEDNSVIPVITKITDNVTVTDTVNVIDTVTERVNTPAPIFFSIEHCLTVAMNDPRWVKANRTNQDELSRFNEILERGGIYEKNPADYKRHFGHFKGKHPDKLKTAAVISMDEWHKLAEEYDKTNTK